MTDARLPWFPCEPAKLLGALAGMKAPEGYVYVIVLLRIYEDGGPLRDTIDALATRTRLNRRAVTDALDRLFRAGRLERRGDGIINPIAERVIADSRARHEKRVHAGSAGGKKAAEKREVNQSRETSKAQAEHQPTPPHLQEQLFPNGNNTRPAGRVSDWPTDYREQFWKYYPRRTEKKAAISKLDAVAKSGKVRWADFLAGLLRHATASVGAEERYIKHPTTWLNRGCWEDEVRGDAGGRPTRNGTAAAALDAIFNQEQRGHPHDDEHSDHPGGEVISPGSTRGDHATPVRARER